MSRRRHCLSLASVLFAGLGTAVAAHASIRAVGHVFEVRPGGDALIWRREGARVAAVPGALLFGGDRIMVSGDAVVGATVFGRLLSVDAETSGKVIGDRPLGHVDPDDEAYFAQFSVLVGENQSAIPQYGRARESRKTDYSLSPSPLAPTGPQLLPEGSESIALVWRGGSSRIQVRPPRDGDDDPDSGNSAWVRLRVPPGTDRFTVQLVGHPLQWSFRIVAKGVVEQSAGGRRLKEGYAARVRWALETLLSGPPAYDELRVAALSIIGHEAQRRDRHNEFARVVWLAARNGRLEALLACLPGTPLSAC